MIPCEEKQEDDGWLHFGTIYQHRALHFKMRVVGFTMDADADRNVCETILTKERYAITQKTLDSDYVLVWKPSGKVECVRCGKVQRDERDESFYKVDETEDSFRLLCPQCFEKEKKISNRDESSVAR